MRCGTSFFNGTIWKKTFFRFWPIWASYLVVWVMGLPLQGVIALQRDRGQDMLSFAAGVGVNNELCLIVAVAFGLLAAMAVCSHLYSARSANFMGALPVRRTGMFLSHYLSGLSMLVLPNLVVALLTLLVEVAGGVVEWTSLLFWLISLSGLEFFFYSFAVFLGMFAGHLLVLPVFYGVFNALAIAVYGLMEWLLSRYYYGYTMVGPEPGLVAWLTPVYRLSYLSLSYVREDAGVRYIMSSVRDLAVYAVVGLVLMVCALLLYRRRQMELAGDVVAVRAMRPVFKYGVALCAGLFFGFVTSLVLSIDEVGLTVAILLWGVVGYFVAQMLLDKSFRVFHKWKGAVAVTGVFLLLFAVVFFDLTGYENRVLDPSRVTAVTLSGLRFAPGDSGYYFEDVVMEDAEEIRQVIDIHKAIVSDRAGTADGERYVEVRLRYELTDGSIVSRYYEIWLDEEDLGQEGTVTEEIAQLVANPALLWRVYGFDTLQTIQDEGGRLTEVSYVQHILPESAGEAGGEAYWADIVTEDTMEETYFYSEDAAALLEAVIQDFWDGALGQRAIMGEYGVEERSLSFTMAVPVGSSVNTWGSGHFSVQVVIPDTALRTLAVLAELTGQ